MIPGRIHTPQRVLRSIWSKRWLIMLLLVMGTLIAGSVAKTLPDHYRSQTTILVVPQRVPEAYVRSTVAPLEGRLPTLTKQILSRTRLERIITDFDLYSDLRREDVIDVAVETMRGSIEIQTTTRDASFTIGFSYGDPVVVAKVTDRLASLFIEESLRDREVLADGTSEFLETQLEEAKQRLMEVEKRLEDYRRRYAGELPAQLSSNLQMIASLSTQTQVLSDAISRNRDRRVTVQGLIADLSLAVTVPVVTAGGELAAPAHALPAAQRLELARREFQSIEERLKPDHPDYVRAKRQLQEIERAVEQEAQRPADVEIVPTVVSPGELARRDRLTELRAELSTLDRQIAQQTAQEQLLRQEIPVYRARVEAVPTRESEMTELMRDYSIFSESYHSLLAKKQDSQIAANLERRQVGEQFKVLDPAVVQDRPVSPNRPLIVLIGAVLGLGLGVGLSLLLYLTDTSLRGEGEVVQALSLPVLATIPRIVTRSELSRRRRRQYLAMAGAALLLIGAVAAFWTVGRSDLVRFP